MTNFVPHIFENIFFHPSHLKECKNIPVILNMYQFHPKTKSKSTLHARTFSLTISLHTSIPQPNVNHLKAY